MTIYKFPFNKDPKGNEQKEHVHQPEYVILEEDEDSSGSRESSQDRECLNTFHHLQKMRFSPFVRILFFWAGSISFIISFLLFLVSSIGLLLSLLTFQQVPAFRVTTLRFWNGCCRMAVFSLGLIVGAFSPVFGLGLIALYFLMIGESPRKNSFFVRVFSRG